MRRKKPLLTVLEAVLILLVAFTWFYLFTGAVKKETRLESRGYSLDSTGAPVEVWEQGKGYRPPTQEEEEYDLDRKEGMQE